MFVDDVTPVVTAAAAGDIVVFVVPDVVVVWNCLLISLDGISEDDFCFFAGGEPLRSFFFKFGSSCAPDLIRHFSKSLVGLINVTFSTRDVWFGLSVSNTRS